MEEKVQLRQRLKTLRQNLSDMQVQDYSENIVKNLISYINWAEIKTINVFQTISSNKEVEISSLLDFIKQNHPNIQIDTAEGKTSAAQAIPEGKNYDLIIVPLIGFDRTGNRLGYGGGYYDKFLARNKCRQTVGVAYGLQEVEDLPVEKHDQKLDLIITEKEVIKP